MEVIWTARAKISYFKVLDYLHENWTKKEMLRFIGKTEMVIDAIKRNPGIFQQSEVLKGVRKAHIDKNNSFFYQVEKNKIYLLTFFDNRQNPDNLKL